MITICYIPFIARILLLKITEKIPRNSVIIHKSYIPQNSLICIPMKCSLKCGDVKCGSLHWSPYYFLDKSNNSTSNKLKTMACLFVCCSDYLLMRLWQKQIQTHRQTKNHVYYQRLCEISEKFKSEFMVFLRWSVGS